MVLAALLILPVFWGSCLVFSKPCRRPRAVLLALLVRLEPLVLLELPVPLTPPLLPWLLQDRCNGWMWSCISYSNSLFWDELMLKRPLNLYLASQILLLISAAP